jgi:hypothetical protein
MKKLILTTSALTLVAGAAVADIDLSAEATVSYGNWDTMNGAAAYAFGTTLNADLEETTSTGITVTGSMEIDVDLITGAVSTSAGEISIATPSIGTFTFGPDHSTALEDANEDEAADVTWDYANGALTLGMAADTTGAAEVNGEAWMISVGYDAGAADLGLDYYESGAWDGSVGFGAGSMDVTLGFDSTNAWDIAVGTEFSGIGVTVTYDSADVAGVELDGDTGGVSWELAANTNDEWSVDLSGSTGSIDWSLGTDETGDMAASVASTMGATSFELAYDSANAGGYGDDAEIVLTIEHTVDMLTLGAMVNDQSEYEVSATAGFSF